MTSPLVSIYAILPVLAIEGFLVYSYFAPALIAEKYTFNPKLEKHPSKILEGFLDAAQAAAKWRKCLAPSRHLAPLAGPQVKLTGCFSNISPKYTFLQILDYFQYLR